MTWRIIKRRKSKSYPSSPSLYLISSSITKNTDGIKLKTDDWAWLTWKQKCFGTETKRWSLSEKFSNGRFTGTYMENVIMKVKALLHQFSVFFYILFYSLSLNRLFFLYLSHFHSDLWSKCLINWMISEILNEITLVGEEGQKKNWVIMWCAHSSCFL